MSKHTAKGRTRHDGLYIIEKLELEIPHSFEEDLNLLKIANIKLAMFLDGMEADLELWINETKLPYSDMEDFISTHLPDDFY